jgi:orotidine-5'-phosphate decarboxylase
MQFLKTLFWVALAVILVLFAHVNWEPATLNLWGGLQADVKLPILILFSFLLGAVPMFAIHRARMWTMKRRLDALERQATAFATASPAPTPSTSLGQPVPAAPEIRPEAERIATDTKVWPGHDQPHLRRDRHAGSGARPGDRGAVRGHVGGLKLGLEFFSANGRQGIRTMADLGLPIFLDLKLHDIPNTVGKAVQALRPLDPAILTVHAAGGRAMMEDAKAAAPSGTKVVAVTVLTSLDGDDLRSIGVAADAHAQVERLTGLARDAGLDGVVCSGNEVAAAKRLWPGGFFVVPGIRPSNGQAGDRSG